MIKLHTFEVFVPIFEDLARRNVDNIVSKEPVETYLLHSCYDPIEMFGVLGFRIILVDQAIANRKASLTLAIGTLFYWTAAITD